MHDLQPTASTRVPVVLDTDIGSDVDDLLALIVLAAEPRIDLRAITTVYGDVQLRARMASRVMRLLGRQDVPVHAGEVEPQSGREVWWPGHEGEGLTGLADEAVSPLGGVDALLEAAARHPGELVVIAIGPQTNLAAALDRDPRFADGVRRLIVMGGEFAEGRPEHNIRCDVVAAEKVLASGIPTTYVGLDVTTRVWIDEDDLATVTASAAELAAVVDRQVRRWWAFIERDRCNPHDPLAVLALIEPELFTFRPGDWTVQDRGEALGAMLPRTDSSRRSATNAADVDIPAAHASIVRRLEAAMAKEGGR